MKRLTLILTLTLSLMLVALGSAGCSTTEAPNDNKAVSTPTPAAPVAPAAATPGAAKPSTATTAAVTGVAACDEYLTRIEKCLESRSVPEAAKAAYRQSLEQNRAAWKQASATPQGKAALATSCQAALDSAKSFLASCK
jgi:hypothetical protein